MDTAARIEAARARLEAGRAIALKAKESGPPCKDCRYFVQSPAHPPEHIAREAEDLWWELLNKGGLCRHPALAEHVYSHVSGELRSSARAGVVEARKEDGLCGPEAVLFEKKSVLRIILQGPDY